MAAYRWRFRERWLLDIFAYQYEDEGRIAASKDFNYNGVEFTAGAVVDCTLLLPADHVRGVSLAQS